MPMLKEVEMRKGVIAAKVLEVHAVGQDDETTTRTKKEVVGRVGRESILVEERIMTWWSVHEMC